MMGTMEQNKSVTGAAPPEAPPPTLDQVRDALMAVVDPEIGLPIVELGLVYDIQVGEEGDVTVVYTLTSLGCPVGPLIEQQVRAILDALPGVRNVDLQMTFSPPWGPEKMSEEAKAALGYF